ncbi:hypothetical protein V8Z74_02795 [Comamonas sp. w2-DMI]|uniref:hypothetical protein n=1 Tax=Comamonas TaxID=283 RepID=UPI0032E36AEB
MSNFPRSKQGLRGMAQEWRADDDARRNEAKTMLAAPGIQVRAIMEGCGGNSGAVWKQSHTAAAQESSGQVESHAPQRTGRTSEGFQKSACDEVVQQKRERRGMMHLKNESC